MTQYEHLQELYDSGFPFKLSMYFTPLEQNGIGMTYGNYVNIKMKDGWQWFEIPIDEARKFKIFEVVRDATYGLNMNKREQMDMARKLYERLLDEMALIK